MPTETTEPTEPTETPEPTEIPVTDSNLPNVPMIASASGSRSEVSISKIALIQFLCTIVIVLAGYVFANQIILSTNEKIDTLEYSKAGGEENYKLLREIQKEQVDTYIRDYSRKDPEYFKRLRAKIWLSGSGWFSVPTEKTLTSDEIATLKTDTPVFGNSGATITLVEFSDFSCEHCREFHTSNAISDLVSASSGTVNSLFKNVPNKKDSSSVRLAETGRCVNTLAGSGAYRTYADKIFATPDPAASSEGLQIASELKLDTTETLACATSPKTKESLDREFGQGIYLGIKVTPSTVVVNVKTGKYRIVEGNVGKSEIESVIRALSE